MLIYHFLDHFHNQTHELRARFVQKTDYQPKIVVRALALYQGCDEEEFRSQRII